MVLRDFFGKIIPGLIFLSTIVVCVAWEDISLSEFTKILSSLSLFGWLAIFGAGWISAFGIQAFGEFFPPSKEPNKRLIRYYPPQFPNDEAWYKFRLEFQNTASKEDLIDVERLVVIKEACGNGYVSLALSLVFAISCIILRYREYGPELRIAIPVFLMWVFIIYYLWKMHKLHVERQHKYMMAVLDRSKKNTVSSSTQ